MKNKVSRQDSILNGITIEELIDTVHSNEKVINEESVLKVFNEIFKANVESAQFSLAMYMKFILAELKSNKRG
jgi:hypothetical protein